jgi:phosphoglycolate phosphatase-like HAD superfamily hydrolase
MNLVVFDLDGTLAKTVAADEHCFVQALAGAFGIEEVSTNWSDYEHVTDSGVIGALFRDRFGRAPLPNDLSKFIEYFVTILERHHRVAPDAFREMPGAATLLGALRRQSHWGVAIATGGFEVSARFKMRAAGLDASEFPAAFAEDGPARESIVQTAMARASICHQQSRFDRIVSVGDAVWDVDTAKRLRLAFVGVAHDGRAERMRERGTSHVVEDFADVGHCLRCLEEAKVPA